MPTYCYECTECGTQIEVRQSISDPPLTNCEFCNGELRKIIQLSSFHLKGNGWAKDGYQVPKNN